MARRAVVGVLALILLLAVSGLLAGCSAAGRGGLPVSRVASRVELIRGLRFARLPVVHLADGAEIRAIVAKELPPRALGPAASDFTRPVSTAAVPVVERLEALELVGAVPVGTTFGQVLFGGGEDPGGLFEPRTGVIYVRRGSGSGFGGQESVLAHELTHALEFQSNLHAAARLQRIAFDQLEASRALVEGPAVLVQYLYAKRHLAFPGTLSQFLARFSAAAQRLLHLPRVLLADAVFPYVYGTRFADRLLKTGGWAAVSAAERRPPSSTQSVLTSNPTAEGDPKFNVAGILGSRWRAEPRQSFGAYDTATLLAHDSLTPSSSLIRLWRGGSLQLWNDLRASRITRCRRPCAAHSVILASWRWANSPTAEIAASDLRKLLTPILTRSPGGPSGLRTLLGSSIAIVATSRFTTIAIAPTSALADALAVANHEGG